MATAKKTTPKAAGTAVAVKKTSAVAVANIKELLAKQAADNAGRIAPGGGKSIRVGQDKSFTLPDGTKTREPLQLVVVDFVSRNEYYDRPYNKDEVFPPACFAIHANPKELTPSASSPDKQNDACSDCPMNAFGSSPTGSGKACSNTRLLAVLPPEANDETDIWLLKVSATAIKEFDGFVAGVNRTFQLPPVGVVVTVDFNEAKDYPSLTFSDPQPNDNVAVHLGRQEEAREMLMHEPDVSNYTKDAPKKGSAAPARKAAVRPRVGAR
jgi:hypothetical protein